MSNLKMRKSKLILLILKSVSSLTVAIFNNTPMVAVIMLIICAGSLLASFRTAARLLKLAIAESWIL